MKPHLDIKHTGTLGDENRRRMTFDENSVAHLMSVLTDMYSDTELAPIREYSTNAWDAHRAAGISDPIEITRPTSLNPMFTVKDHGIGMSEEDVLENFSRYGWSSKRDSDDEVGMLGLGCKSALTYTSQFTMIVTKDCIQVTVLVTRDPDGAGVVQIVDRQPSTDPNGVEVQIPVKSVHSFNSKITTFFQYWDRGTVLIDGEQPESIWESKKVLVKLSDDVILVMANSTTRDHVVMGNVAYPVDNLHRIVPKMDNVRVVLRVPIGAVNFTPSRESLHYTKRTETLLAEKRDFIMATALKKAQEDIDAAPTHTEALRRVMKWREAHSYFKYTYKGVEVPAEWRHPKLTEDEDENKPPYGQHIFKWHANSQLDWNASRSKRMRASEALEGLHVVGFEGKSLYRGIKQRIKLYFEQQNMDPCLVFFYPLPFMDPWIDDAKVVNIETIKAIDIPREQRVTVKKQGYRVLNAHGTDHLVRDMPRGDSPHPIPRNRYDRDPIYGPEEPGPAKDLIVMEAGLYNTVDKRRLAGQLIWHAQQAGENIAGVIVTKTELKRFMVDHPTAVKFGAWLEKRIASYYGSITGLEAALYKGYLRSSGRSSLWGRLNQISSLPRNKILDPDLRAAIAKFETARDISTDIDLFKKAACWVWDSNASNAAQAAAAFIKLPVLPASNANVEITEVLNRYPLVTARGSGIMHGVTDAHFVEYINCVYTRKYRPETRKVELP